VTRLAEYREEDDATKNENDFSLIQIEGVFSFDDTVRPACISTSFEDYDEKASLKAVGWGRTNPTISCGVSFNIAEETNVLKEANFNYNRDCQNHLICINPVNKGDR
jgi:hypothetical protein